MYALHREIIIGGGSTSYAHRNVTVYFNDSKNLTYAAIAHRGQVNTVSWDPKIEGMANDQILVKEPEGGTRQMSVIQTKYCWTKNRALPLLVVCANFGTLIYEPNGSSLLCWQPVSSDDANFRFTRGITQTGSYILVGAHTGEIFVFNVAETSVKIKSTLKEHSAPVVDLASDLAGETVLSASTDGVIVIYDSKLKSTQKISTGQPLNCVAVSRKYAFAGTVLGVMLVYSANTGEIAAEVAAHARNITSIDVANEARMIMTTSEDSFVRVWKFYTKKPDKSDTFEIDCKWSESVENAPLVGGIFSDLRGDGLMVTAFDYSNVFYFRQPIEPKK